MQDKINLLVSIIIPTYNRAHLILETVKSIVAQTYQNWECIVIDDVSTDNTIDVINDFCKNDNRFKFYQRDRLPRGGNTCRNIGIDKAKGDFIYFFDSDDIMYPDLLQSFINEFDKNRALDFCCCEYDYFEENKIVSSTNNNKLNHSIASHLENYAFSTHSFLTRNSVISELGKWDETIIRCQDVDYFNKLFFLKKKGNWINISLYKVRIHNKNVSSTWNKAICLSLIKVHEKIRLLYKNTGNRELNDIIGKRITAFSISALASGYWKVAWSHFWGGLFLLPRSLFFNRLFLFLKLSFFKPFKKNVSVIIMHH